MTKKTLKLTAASALAISTIVPVVAVEVQAAKQYANDLLISEYVEGSSNDKAIELYNGTGRTIDLSEYTLGLHSNGAEATSNSYPLSGTLEHGQTIVYVNGQAKQELLDIGTKAGVINFNGNDAIVLKKGQTIIDSFGEVGNSSDYAKDVTYVRNSDNFVADIDLKNAIDFSGWTQFGNNTFDHLGSHTANHGKDLSEGSITIAEAIATADSADVQVEGTLLGFSLDSAHIFDGEKAIAIYKKDAVGTAQLGDYLVVKGKRANHNGLELVSNAELVTSTADTASPTPTPKVVTLSEIGENLESRLVTVNNVTITENTSESNFTIEGSNHVIVRDELSTGIIATTTYDSITGIVLQDNDTYQIVPRFASDIVTQAPPAPPLTTIAISEARAQETGTVQVQGVVTAVIGTTVHIQDATGAIVLYGSVDAKVGDEIVVSGIFTTYKGLLEIKDLTLIENKGQAALPTPKVVNFAELGEAVEAELIEVQGLKIGEYSNGNYSATDAQGNVFTIRDSNKVSGLETGKTYDRIFGVVQQFDAVYQILPRSAGDVIEDSSVVQSVVASASGTVAKGSAITLATNTANAKIYYTTDGTDPTEESRAYTDPIKINENQTIKAIAVKDGLGNSAISTFTYEIFEGALKIHHLQGESHVSPFKGQNVTNIEGIVTYLFKISGSHYATIQTPDTLVDGNPNTSEGILVYIGSSYDKVAVGDHVSVSGKVDEYRVEGNEGDLYSTQINARNGKIETIASGVALPAAIEVTGLTLPREVIDNDEFAEFDPQEDAIDYWESIEGMRVSFSALKATAPQSYGDISTVLETRETDTNNGGILITASDYNADRIHLKVFKGNGNVASDFNVSTGDMFKGETPIIGVVGYGFSNYKVYVDETDIKAAYKSGNIQPEETKIVYDSTKLTVANYNIENFSATTSAAKVKLIADSFVNNMKSPDIIGIVEMQDNDGEKDSGSSAADLSFQRLIDAIVEAGGPRYNYVNIDPVYNQDGGAPGANIRPGFLYNPGRVSLKEGIAGDATTAVTYKDGELSHNPGLVNPKDPAFSSSRKPIAAQFTFNGEDVIVIANHFNSKGGDTALFGGTQPVVLSSEVQRRAIAEQLKTFVQSITTDNPKANIVTLGDFNDFEFSEPLKILESAGLANMINELPRSDRYTYTYQGNSQVLDHILVSNHLKARAVVDALHINSDFSSVSGKRASDHDPVLVQIDLTKEVIETPELVTLQLKGKQTGKLVLTKQYLDVAVAEGFKILNGVTIKGHKDGSYIRITGALSEQVVTIEAKHDAEFTVDFADANVKEVIITGDFAKKVKILNDNKVQKGLK